MPTCPSTTRRGFLETLLAGGAAASMARSGLFADELADQPPHYITCQQVPWAIYSRREGRKFDLEAAVAGAAEAGLDGFEPIVTSAEQVARLGRLLRKHGLSMRSLYVEGTLHEERAADETDRKVLAIADAAWPLGTKIVLLRPLPIPNGREFPKSDEQLTLQAEWLDRLGAQLRDRQMTLAWPNHDVELLHSAREFHHMLAGTNPNHVGLCLDAHWVYRATGNSQVALLDIVTLYAPRIVELHLRQSRDGTFTEAFGNGDIDYPRLWDRLNERAAARPLLTLDQAPESGTLNTMSAIEAHRQGRTYIRSAFQSRRM